MQETAWAFFVQRWPELWVRVGEHLVLTGVSTGLAVAAGVPLGILAERRPGLRRVLLAGVGILQTIPSLAMLALLLVLLQRIGAVPAVVALTLYALLPIVRNTTAGLESVPPAARQAAVALGMDRFQKLTLVEIPLALPVIIAGIRTAAVVGVGVATLSAFIGAGGLGQFINRGLALSNPRLILLGALPAAALALLVDATLGLVQGALQHSMRGGGRSTLGRLKPIALMLPVLLLVAGAAVHYANGTAQSSSSQHDGPVRATIRVGSKNFTEQLILGELMAQMIESRTDLRVDRRFNLGGTMICHEALLHDEIDLYAEYVGTGLVAILHHDVMATPDRAWQAVRGAYEERFAARWLDAFGFNNTYALTVRSADAERFGWKLLSDLAPVASTLRGGFTGEFAERSDGYTGLQMAYGFSFGAVSDLDPALMYEAIARDEVDVICAFATDGRIPAYDLQPLEDDRGFFPPYEAAPVIRTAVAEMHPDVVTALHCLAGRLDDETMRRLNYEVDAGKRTPADVARQFLSKLATNARPEVVPPS